MAESHFSSLSNCLLQPPHRCPYSHPIHLGASFISHLPFLVLSGSLFTSVLGVFFVLFFSLDFKIPSTAKVLPPFSARKVLHTLDNSAEV